MRELFLHRERPALQTKFRYQRDLLHSVCNFELMNIGSLDASAIRAMYQRRVEGSRDKMEVALVMFMRGTPIFYNGEEIGMRRMALPDIADFKDNLGVWAYEVVRQSHIALRLGTVRV